MIVQSIRVKRFRSIYDQTLHFDSLTALVGRNGSGKSSFLRAVEHFYARAVNVVSEDFYDEDTSQDIDIVVTFTDLTDIENQHFNKYVVDGTLTVSKVFSMASTGKVEASYHGERLQHPGYKAVRGEPKKADQIHAYRLLREQEPYTALPQIRSADDALLELEKWESEHPDQCKLMRDDGKFFGFTGVGQGYLGRYTKFIKVPAVRDAAEEAADGKGSCIAEIMDLVVRSSLDNEAFIRLQDDTHAELLRILDPARQGRLGDLQSDLTRTLQHYVSDASVSVEWSDLMELKIPPPKATVSLIEDGYRTTVERTGHGLQRAFILTMLQHLASAREHHNENYDETVVRRMPSLLLAIEEPELYQHPSRQRHFSSVLRRLADGSVAGVSNNTQVVYTTHAPLFVSLDRFDQIRILRKDIRDLGSPKITVVSMTSLQKVAQILWHLSGDVGTPYTSESLLTRMQAIMTPWMNEGFFADVVVLVEGETDRAAILAIAETMGYELPELGVAVIPCGGKASLDRPAIVFGELGIRTYLIWDNDEKIRSSKRKEVADKNRLLLRIVGAAEEDWPSQVEDSHACLRGDLQDTIKDDLSQSVFEKLLTDVVNEYGVKRKNADKNPTIINALIHTAKSSGYSFPSLESIVQRIARAAKAEPASV